MADALFTRTQQRVLAVLFSQPERSFYVNEIIARANAGRGAVLRELDRLGRSRLVVVRKIGNQKHYQANAESPIFDELRSIVGKTVGLVEPIRAALEPLRDQIELAFVFGSVAKGEDTAASDIDILAVTDTLIATDIMKDLYGVEYRLGRQLQLVVRSSDEFVKEKTAEDSFVTRILRSPVIFLIGSTSDVQRLCGT